MSAPLIDAALVRRLVAAQFPAWAGLPVEPVLPGGNDNRTFRLGEGLSVRLPSHERYAAQAAKEQRWLPVLAPWLPLPIPAPAALGRPGEGFPWPWSVNRWLEGETARRSRPADWVTFARDLAGFLTALQAVDAGEGPAAGPHSFWRGGPLSTYDRQTREAIATLGDAIDGRTATAIWEAALAATWAGPPVWVHGDIAAGNLLVREGALSAVIDFGCCAVGDPACDLVIAWTLFEGAGPAAFRDAMAVDEATWARARGWALWKALILMAAGRHGEEAEPVLGALVAEA